MAFSKPKLPSMALALLLLLLLLPQLMALLVAVDASDQVAASDPLAVMHSVRVRSLLQAPKLDCPRTCWGRCGNNWKNEMCNKMCNVCCGRCNCVPLGTGQETRHLCPCYDTMVNPHTGKLKCP